MARPLRLHLAGGFFHIVQRGNARQAIFTADRDREAFLERLGRFSRHFDCRVHAYCLMGNHVHLLVETRRPHLSAFGQRLFGSYTLWFNRKRRRTGHLFQGRFKSILVEKDRYLAELSRYIHLNPVRAGMEKKPEAYRWSSLGAYARPGGGEKWVCTREILGRLEGDRKAYLDYVYDGIGKAWKPTAAEGMILGTERFVRRVRERLGWVDGEEAGQARRREAEGVRTARLLRAVEARYGVTREDLLRKQARGDRTAEARRAAMAALRAGTYLTHRRIGETLGGVSAPGVAKAVRLAQADPRLQRTVEQIVNKVNS